MALIGLTSARGAPGVTTTALGMALHWHRPVLLVEADVSGGSAVLAGFLRGTVAHDRGLRDIAVALSLGDPMDEALNRSLIDLPGGRVRLLPGLANAAQAPAVTGLWQPLAQHLRDLDAAGLDVIVDLGRWSARNGPDPAGPPPRPDAAGDQLGPARDRRRTRLGPGPQRGAGRPRARLGRAPGGHRRSRPSLLDPGDQHRARPDGRRGCGVGSADRGHPLARPTRAPLGSPRTPEPILGCPRFDRRGNRRRAALRRG